MVTITRRRLNLKLFIILIIFLSFIFTGLTVKSVPSKITSKSTGTAKTVSKPVTNTFTLIISSGTKGCLGGKGKILLKKVLKVDKNKDVLTFLKENAEVIENGGFITYINKLKSLYPVPDSKMTSVLKSKGVLGIDWFVYLNNKKALVGAGQIYPKKGDVVMVDYHYWNRDEFNTNNN